MSPYAPPRAILRVLSDERLARHAAGGSEQAFSILYDRHARDLLAACRAIVRDDDDARDALQSTMLNAWRAIGRRGDAPVRPWLFRIARNEAITVLRRRRPSAELHEHAGTRPDLHEEAAGRAELAGVLDGIDALSERQREALVLRTLGDAGYDEIARRQATSPEAVRQSVAHARRTLRRRRLAGLIPVPAWIADLAASAGTAGAPAIQAGFAKTAVGVTAAVAVVGGAVGPAGTPRHDGVAPAEARAASAVTRSAAPATAAPATAAAPAVAPAGAGGDPAPATSRRVSDGAPTRMREVALRAPTDAADVPPHRPERADEPVAPRPNGDERHDARRLALGHPREDARERPLPQRSGSSGDDPRTAWTRTGWDRGEDRHGTGDRPAPEPAADRGGPPPSRADPQSGTGLEPAPAPRAPPGDGAPPAQ